MDNDPNDGIVSELEAAAWFGFECDPCEEEEGGEL